jgi:hypothetical protein
MNDSLFCISAMMAKPKNCEKGIQVFFTGADEVSNGK